jgi:hypothetical protein
MSEPITDRLSRFTPDAGGLDRDTLLYAAGRASARPSRAWITLAVALGVTQTLTLALLWPAPAPHPAYQPPAEVYQPPADGPPPADESDSPGVWSARHNLLDAEDDEHPASGSGSAFIDTGPPLRAFAPPSSIMN